MGRKNHTARSGHYSERTVQPMLGARHPIVESEDIAFFFHDVRAKLQEDDVLPPKVEIVNDRFRRRDTFMLYEDPDRMAVTILEQRLARIHSQKNRIRWTKSDTGRIQGDIQNELSRLSLSGRTLSVDLVTAVRLGDADDKKARKIGLLPSQESEITEFFCSEHELAVNGISGSLQRFRYPYSGEWIPHFTIGRLFKEVPRERFSAAINAVQKLLPLTVEIQPLQFYAQQEVRVDHLDDSAGNWTAEA